MNIQPVGNRLLVEPIEEADKVGSIFIPNVAKDPPQRARVVVLGTGEEVRNSDGKVVDSIPFVVKVGQQILVSKYGGSQIKVDQKEYKIINASDILAIIS